MSRLIKNITARGHWSIAIHPEQFDASRVDYAELGKIVERSVVRLRGWPVPFIDYRENVLRGDDWVGQDLSPGIGQPEAWRFFTSGQFNHLRGFSADWRDREYSTPIPAGAQSVVEVWEILFYLTEVFELAGRLALTDAGDERMVIRVALMGLEQRALVVAQPRRAEFMQPRMATMPAIERSVSITRDQLAADARVEAVELARDIFLRFGWEATTEQLAGHQVEIDR
jgi:hypothetical protein